MKRRNGFTLVELLAVVVVLGIVGAIAITSITKVRKKAADDSFKKLEQQIADLGPGIYSHELIVDSDSSDFYDKYKEGDPFIIPLFELIDKEYIKEIKSPYDGSECDGYLYVNPKSTDKTYYKGYLNCGDKYTSGEEVYTNNSSLETATISEIN